MHPNLELRAELDDIRQSIIYRYVIVKAEPLAVQMLLAAAANILHHKLLFILIYFNSPYKSIFDQLLSLAK